MLVISTNDIVAPDIFFKNQYKSILCQEDTYLLELVRYFHLNPLRARLIKDMDIFKKIPIFSSYRFDGKGEKNWQDIEWIFKIV